MHGKHALRSLALWFMAVVGLMAFTAAGAQAANLSPPFTHGKTFVLGVNTGLTSITGAAVGSWSILVPAMSFESTCTDFEVLNGTMSAEGHGTIEILFLGCQIFAINAKGELTSKEPLPCQLLDATSGKVGHLTVKGLTLIVLHENKDYLILEQLNLEETQALGILKYTSGTGCPLQLKQEMKGRIVFEIITGDKHNGGVEVENSAGLLIKAGNTAVQELFTSGLKFGINSSSIDGHATLKLAGAQINCKWGVL